MGGAPPVIPDYALIRPVGRGAYGAVWLARSVTGLYRAAKVIYRDSFEDPRPFEREFAGIQRIEPISRSEEHQLTILHVGRNEAAGYFYYVMELADDIDTGPDIVPERYVPKTLREMRNRAERLPSADCLNIGIALSQALAHLHGHGLVHRDVKPSNVIFVHGVPKLADIGLVSTVDESASFVGTEGFVPPEGPGSIRADLFSLGKVIYEISMGRDRKQFPRLPDNFDALGDKRALLELNEITLKACDPDPKRRYASAEALRDELLLLRAGRSVKRLHAIERRFEFAARYGVAATALTLAAAGAFLWASLQARKAKDNFALSERHRTAAESALRESELSQARARRMTGIAGQRFETLELFRRTANGSNALELRNEAVASLVLPDLRPVRKWSGIATSSAWIFDANLDRYATNDSGGNIFVREVESDRLLATLPAHGSPLTTLIASHDLRFLAAIDRAGTARVWDMQATNALMLDLPAGARLSAFTADGRRLVVKLANGSLAQFDPETGTSRETWRGPFGFTGVTFNEDGTLFFGVTGSDVLVHETATGARVAKLTHPEGVAVAAWHPGGKRIAVGCGARIHVWDLDPKRLVAEWPGHESRVVGLCYDSSGELLISTGWDSTTRLWKDGPRESVRTAAGGNAPRISTDGRRLAFRSWDHSRVELWEVASGAEMRRLAPFSGAGRVYRQTHRAGFHPGGTLLYIDASDGTHLYRVDTFQPVATLNAQTGSQATFNHSGTELFTIAQGNVRAWPVTGIPDQLQLGAPRLLLRSGTARHLATSPQSDLLVTTDHDGFHVFTAGEAGKRSVTKVRGPGLPSISADGRWLATGRDSRLTLWDLAGMHAVTNFTVGPEVRGVFSPDNRWLIGASRIQHLVWEFGSWNLRFSIDRREAKTAWPAAAFSPDGTVAALSTAEHAVRLVETGGFQELATLPASRMITHLCFSPDSTRLLVLYEPGVAELWNLSLVRDRLKELKLGWNHPFPRIPAVTQAIPAKASSHLGNKIVLRETETGQR